MVMLDYDNIIIGSKVRDIRIDREYTVIGSRPDIDDAINGRRGEIVEFIDENGEKHQTYSQQQISEIYEVIK